MNNKHRGIGLLGLLSVAILILAILIFGLLNQDFSFINDFISKLGAKGQPNAVLFNVIGFVVVGFLLFLFGLLYGKLQGDKLLALLLSMFGLGFAFTSFPIDLDIADAPISKAHVVAICLGLAGWLFGLSRMGYNQKLSRKIRRRANLAAVLLMVAMIGFVVGFWSMPITHRLVFGIVFGWVAVTSVELIRQGKDIHARS